MSQAIHSLMLYPLPIRSGEDALILEGVGKSIVDKLDAYFTLINTPTTHSTTANLSSSSSSHKAILSTSITPACKLFNHTTTHNQKLNDITNICDKPPSKKLDDSSEKAKICSTKTPTIIILDDDDDTEQPTTNARIIHPEHHIQPNKLAPSCVSHPSFPSPHSSLSFPGVS